MMVRLFSLVLLCAVAGPVTAQAVAVSPQNASEQVRLAHISVDFRNTPLADAIWTIARRSGTKITFDRKTLPSKKVDYKASGVTPDVALAEALKGTGLRVVRIEAGVLGLTNAEAAKVRANGVVTGKVTDAKTGKGLGGASVTVVEDNHIVTTGADGSYRISGNSVGSRTVVVKLIGYAKQTRSISIVEGATVSADFKLEPSANVLDQVIVTGTVVQTELKAIPNAITVVTAKQIEERGITKIDQLFRGDIPGLFALNLGSNDATLLDEVTMFSRGTTALSGNSAGVSSTFLTNPIKIYIDGTEVADSKYLSQIDPKSIERMEILTGPQASTIYGSNAINGVMQVFTKRGRNTRPQLTLNALSGWVENNYTSARTPQHDYSAQINGIEGAISYNAGASWNYTGPWTPGKQLTRIGGFGGSRYEFPSTMGKVVTDVSLRHSTTYSRQRGDVSQALAGYRETGWYLATNFNTGLWAPITRTLNGQTLGLTLSYSPVHWWSNELGLGQDASDAETRATGITYSSISDTALQLSQSHASRRSLRYTTTASLPITSLSQLTVTAGTDGWQSLTSSLFNFSTQTLTGSLTGTTTISRRPDHNTGAFLQTQYAIVDHLFLTYGLRAEWNPGYGKEAQPNIAPRYGLAYTQEFGSMTAKLRGSYGRSTRPPQPELKDGMTIMESSGSNWGSNASRYLPYYGKVFDFIFANPDLGPEYQQGAEGGVEMYFGTRGSLVITRYNQTVDGLIAQPLVDSIRTLIPCEALSPTCLTSTGVLDADGYGYTRQFQYINLGSIRNQGWELQNSVNLGPITIRGTYSWTKSRTIGINQKYRSFFANQPQYRPGATFKYLPEHTWALGVMYARGASTLGINMMGTGRVMNREDGFLFRNLRADIRIPSNRLRMTTTGYINTSPAYMMADLTASHRFAPYLEGVLQVQNLTDVYKNDFSAFYASIGRQLRVGARIRK